jgi:hypothetical protein
MLKKINVDRMRLGMLIHELCGPWMNHLFWRTRRMICALCPVR